MNTTERDSLTINEEMRKFFSSNNYVSVQRHCMSYGTATCELSRRS